MKTYSRVLAIAGSDSGGGAGIQADIKAISATGSFAAGAAYSIGHGHGPVNHFCL